jgi:hypothetical protein
MKRTAFILILISALLISVLGGVLFVQTLPSHQVMVPSQSPVAQSAPTNQTSPLPPHSPLEAEPQVPSPTEPSASQPTPNEGIIIESINCSTSEGSLLHRFLNAKVSDVVVRNLGVNSITVTSIAVEPNSQSRTFSVIIPPNSTVDIPTFFFVTSWHSGTISSVIVNTAEGYSASYEFIFPI